MHDGRFPGSAAPEPIQGALGRHGKPIQRDVA